MDEEYDEDDVDEDEQSWDGSENGREPPPRPPKEPEERKTTMPQLAPRLPLLYFEHDRVDQIDFAYQQSSQNPSRAHSQAGTSDGGQNQGSNDPTKGTTKIDQPRNRSPGPIDTSIGKSSEAKHDGETVGSPQQDKPSEESTKDERGGSFYWHHSPQSSVDGSQAQSPKPAEDKTSESDEAPKDSNKQGNQDQKKPIVEPIELKQIVSTVPENSLTSATALGLGGPSDWEHFGDYDAEEVDDIALYTSNKPKTAKLPDTSSPGTDQGDENAIDPGSAKKNGIGEREILPTIQEQTSESAEDVTVANEEAGNQQDRSLSPQKEEGLAKAPDMDAQDEGNQRGTTGGDSGSARQSPIHNEVVAEYIANGDDQPTSSPFKEDSSIGLKTKSSDIQDSDHPEDHIVVESTHIAQQAYRSGDARPIDHPRIAEQKTPMAAEHNLKQGIPTPPDVSEGRITSGQSMEASTLSSPVDDDDGKENIIISLQVPDSPPAGYQMQADDRSRENVPMNVAMNQEVKNLESPELLRTGRRSVFPQSIELEDPYVGLDPWAKASLNRYVKMLREEAQAETDEDKFMTFINFTHKETRVRSVLYDMDDESDMSDHPAKRASIKSNSASLRPRVSVRSKALPALPPKDDEPPPVPKVQPENIPKRTETMPNSADSAERAGQNKGLEHLPQPPSTAPPQRSSFMPPAVQEESYVVIDPPSEDRPAQAGKQKPTKEKPSNPVKVTPSLNSLKKALEIVASRAGSSSKDKANTGNTESTKGDAESKSSGQPGLSNDIGAAQEGGDQASQESESAHKAQKHNEGRAYEGDKAANRQSIYRPFSTLLRQSSVRHGSLDSSSEKLKAQDSQRKGTVAGPDAEGQVPGHGNGPVGRPFENSRPLIRPVNYRYTILEPLLLVIPQEGILHQDPHQIVRLREAMDAIPDDFAFIHKTVLAWDAEAKKARERYEHERQARQSQNEARIDALFNDNEIGYADINELEAEFKRSESAKKTEEDREEVATFVASVFDVVWARINYEMDRLGPLYNECTTLVAEASGGRAMFEEAAAAERVPIAPVMEMLLILYQKLMVRHQKAFEAVLERDRRLKKTEVAPWYAAGSVDKVKRIEKRFEDAEKKAILEFCRQRDERANLLMDVLDHNTLRSVSANQDYMESIMQAVRRVGSELASGSTASIDDADAVSSEEVLKAKTVTTALARSSEQIVRTFHTADMLLNAADYEVSVANAKLSNADAAAFRRLREAKAKEDNKLAMDLEHRLGLIRGETARTQGEISKLLALIERRERERERAGSGGGGVGGESGAGGADAVTRLDQ